MEQEDLLAYNTQKKKLILPEYGRNVHRMIEYCMSLEDRDERTRCANAIVNIMGICFLTCAMSMISSINCGIIWRSCPISNWI